MHEKLTCLSSGRAGQAGFGLAVNNTRFHLLFFKSCSKFAVRRLQCKCSHFHRTAQWLLAQMASLKRRLLRSDTDKWAVSLKEQLKRLLYCPASVYFPYTRVGFTPTRGCHYQISSKIIKIVRSRDKERNSRAVTNVSLILCALIN